MIYILDSGIFMNTSNPPKLSNEVVYCSQRVVDEIQSRVAGHLWALFKEKNKITIMDPEVKFVTQIRTTASHMGQKGLSTTDVEVLALALMLSKFESVLLLSDDYAVRNVAHQLNISSEGVTTSGGDETRQYVYTCLACHVTYTFLVDECDVCGSSKFQRKRRFT